MGANGIYGLSGSGLDIESLVKMGMLNKQNQYDKMYQKEVQNTWLKEAYNDVYSKMNDFKASMTTFKMQSNMNAMGATSGDSGVVTATANGAAAAMTHRVAVTDIASNAYLMTGMKSATETYTVDRASGNKTSTLLKDVVYQKMELTGGTKKGEYTYNVKRADGSTAAVNGSDVAISLTLQDSTKLGDDGKPVTYKLEYTYDDLYQNEKSLYDLATGIAGTGANIQGSYDTNNDSFSFYNKTSGSENIVGLTVNNSDTATLLNNMHLASYSAKDNSLTNLDSFISDGTPTVFSGAVTRAMTDDEIAAKGISANSLMAVAGWNTSQLSVDDITEYNKGVKALKTTEQKAVTAAGTVRYSVSNYALNVQALDALKAKSDDTLTDEERAQKASYEALLSHAGVTALDSSVTDYYWEANVAPDTGSYAIKQKSEAASKTVPGSHPTGITADDIENVSYKLGNVKLGSDKAMSFSVSDGTKSAIIDFTYEEMLNGASLSDLAAKINSEAAAKGLQLNAEYNDSTGSFQLNSYTGDAVLTAADTNDSTSRLVANLGLTKIDAPAPKTSQSFAGTNAMATIDGKSYDLSTNTLTVSGVTYTFNSTTETGKTVAVNVRQDTSKITDYVKQFVEGYNALIDDLNSKLSEERYSDYKPLTKKQEGEMTETQITKWNEKAKSGLLYHDSTVRELVSGMREALYTKVDAVDSKYNSMAAIGITTTNVKGHITLNEDKLAEALAADPDCVYQLFASDQDSSYIPGSTNKDKSHSTAFDKKNDYLNTGIANRLYNVMGNYMDRLSDYAGKTKDTDDNSYLGKLITNLQTKMTDFKTQMTAYEKALYKRYDAMEVALSRLNVQLGYITGYGN